MDFMDFMDFMDGMDKGLAGTCLLFMKEPESKAFDTQIFLKNILSALKNSVKRSLIAKPFP